MKEAWQGTPAADDRGSDQPRVAWQGEEGAATAQGSGPPGDQLAGDDAAEAENAQNEAVTMTMPGITGYEFVNPSFTSE